MNVLIVEDNANMRRMMRSTFEHHNCSVIEAKDGLEGLEKAALARPDIIISDALMPRMDGFQLLRALKADPDLKSIPFLFYSAIYDGDQEEKLALSLGAEAFIDKPTEPDALWEKICAITNAASDGCLPCREVQTERGEAQYLSEYSQIVATKLEEKVYELEEALLRAQAAEDRLQRLNAELELRVALEVEKNIAQDRIMAHQARLAAMGEMLSNISHQWRQPLNNVALIIQNLQAEFEDRELSIDSCSAYVAECMKYLTYMSGTIDNFQAFYLTDHKQQIFNPCVAINDIIALIKEDMEFHGIKLVTEVQNNLSIYGYKKEFAQVIMNVIMNSKDSIQKTKPLNPFIQISMRGSDQSAIITIRDNGGGIPADIIDKVFDPYFTTKFMAQGVGMGLYMSKMIVEKHMHGQISVSSTDSGTEITIELPLGSNQ
jgi:signal transduction histidine kinase